MKPSTARGVALVALTALGLGTFACGPPVTPVPANAAPLPLGPALVAPAAAPVRAEPPPRAPEDLALLLRVNDPEQLAREVISLLPPSATSMVGQLDAKQVVSLLLGTRLASTVDLGQPIDVASLGTHDGFSVSFAVKPEAEAGLGARFVLRDEAGLAHVEPSDEHDAGRMKACAFTAAAGHATTRLVCASDDLALEASAKYLARTVAAEPFDADARLSAPGRLLRDRRETTTKAMGDAASSRLGSELVEKFYEEVERMDADVRFAGKSVELSFDLRLAARESMLARVLVPRSKPAPPPRAFFRLPADSLLALHATGALPDDIAPLRRMLVEALERSLVQDGYQPAKTRALCDRLEALVLTGGPVVVGAGIVSGREGAEKALAAMDGPTKPAEVARAEAQARSALVGWMIAEVDEPPSRWTEGLRDIVKRADDADKTRAPGSKSSLPTDPDGDHVDVRVGSLDASLRLPKDTLHLEVLLTPTTKGTHPTRRAHVLVVPKGSETWLGYSEDLGALASRLRTALDDAIEAGTLSRSTEAASLRTRPALVAGLTSIAGLGLLSGKTTSSKELLALSKTASRMSVLGAHGAETFTWSVSGDATAGSVRVGARVQTSRQVIRDLVQLLAL